MNKLFLLILVTLITSCNNEEEIDLEIVQKISEYSNGKNILIKNLNSINETLNKKEKHLSFRNWNLFYFQNSILPENKELSPLINFYKNNLVVNKNPIGGITIKKDSTVIFTIKHFDGTFSGISHYLVYNRNGKSRKIENIEELLNKKRIKNEWTYLVIKKYYAY